MSETPIPGNETGRLERLESYQIMDTPTEERFDNLTRLAAEICDVPICLISLLDEERQWFKSRWGLNAEQTPRDISFCQYAIMGQDTFEVQDAADNPTFMNNPLVTGDPNIRFYAGHPLHDDDFALGTLCVIDVEPKQLDNSQKRALKILAQEVVFMIRQTKELKEREQYKKFFDMSLDMLCIAGTDGYFKAMNPSFTKVLGWSTDELLAKPFVEFIHPDDVPATMAEVEKLAGGAMTIGFENRYQRKDGGWTWMHWTCQPDMATGELFAVAHDITELKVALSKLEDSNTQLDQFAYVVSHDLKSPLRAISTLSLFLEEDLEGKLDEETGKNFKLLRSRVSRMEALINGILEYSRVGRVKEEMTDVNVKELLNEIIAGLMIPDGFEVRIADDLPVIQSNPVHLQQVFQNLISNALKYHNKEAGVVSVAYESLENEHEFRITDDGPGIDPQYHEKIFGIFQTLQSRDEVESTGVGLSIVKKIMDEYGGSVTIESELGKGSTFVLRFPK